MTGIFITAAVIAALFSLPGGNRSQPDRQLAQIAAFCGVAAALFTLRLGVFGLVVLMVGAGLFGIGWLKSRLTGEGFQDLNEDVVSGSAPTPPVPSAQMDRSEALAVLGLSGDPDELSVTDAHRRMIQRTHPDAGGSDYLAGKINAARDVLLADTVSRD